MSDDERPWIMLHGLGAERELYQAYAAATLSGPILWYGERLLRERGEGPQVRNELAKIIHASLDRRRGDLGHRVMIHHPFAVRTNIIPLLRREEPMTLIGYDYDGQPLPQGSITCYDLLFSKEMPAHQAFSYLAQLQGPLTWHESVARYITGDKP